MNDELESMQSMRQMMRDIKKRQNLDIEQQAIVAKLNLLAALQPDNSPLTDEELELLRQLGELGGSRSAEVLKDEL